MTSKHFHISGPLWGESTCQWEIPSQRANDVELICFSIVSLNKLLNKHSSCEWFEMPWKFCNITAMQCLSSGITLSCPNFRAFIFWKIFNIFYVVKYLFWGCKDYSVYAPSQWEMALQCNAISHWLGAYTEWSLGWWLRFPFWDLCFWIFTLHLRIIMHIVLQFSYVKFHLHHLSGLFLFSVLSVPCFFKITQPLCCPDNTAI